jgi:hypothetical protein
MKVDAVSTNQASEPTDTSSPLAKKSEQDVLNSLTDSVARQVDHYVTLLDHKFDGKWDIWRTASKEWCVNLPAYRQTFSGKSLFVVLRDASRWVPLPTYPRRSELVSRDRFEVRKQASGKWEVLYDGYTHLYNIETKKKANEYADSAVARNVKSLEAWDEKYGQLTSGKTEGVDFRWEK